MNISFMKKGELAVASSLTLYVSINVFCIFILLMILFKIKNNTSVKHYEAFGRVIITNCILFGLDFIWVLSSEKGVEYIGFNWLCASFYFIVSAVFGYVWYLYSEEEQGSFFIKKKIYLFVAAIPMVALSVVTLCSIKTKWIFYIDENNVYHRGGFYWL